MLPGDNLHSANTTEDPTHVILCTWTGAEDRPIQHYKNAYLNLFGGTDKLEIIIIKTTIRDLCFRSSATKQHRLQSIVSKIPRNSSPRVLLHVFSEGGSHKACELAEAYHHQYGKRLPVSAMILDSTPGKPHLDRLCKAGGAALQMPHPFRHMGAIFASVVIVAAWAVCHIKGYDHNIIDNTRIRLLKEELWSFEAPRFYLYSTADDLILSADIEDHIKLSENCGITVRRHNFHTSQHVAHERDYSLLYWKLVRETWNASQSK